MNFFKDHKLHSPYWLMKFCLSLKKLTCAYLFQIALEIVWLPRQSRFYFVFIPEFVERLPTIFPVNIWITNLFEIEHRWAKWLISDPSTEGTLWISDPVIRLQITQISDPMIRLLISLRSVIQWSVFRSRRSGIWWILVQSGFDRSLIWKWICSKGTPQIRNPDSDSPKGTHP